MTNLENMIIDLNPNDKSVINISDKPSVNFGGGIELLMNDKKKGASTELGIGELSDLENDLNTWKGIETNEQGRIIEIVVYLGHGIIPKEIEKLSELEVLATHQSGISGKIPSES